MAFQTKITTPKITKISAGRAGFTSHGIRMMHSVVLDINNDIWTFGANDGGQLGQSGEDTGTHATPTKVVFL